MFCIKYGEALLINSFLAVSFGGFLGVFLVGKSGEVLIIVWLNYVLFL